MNILTNHIGYEVNAPKKAILQTTEAAELLSYSLVCDGNVLLEGIPQNVGIVPNWKNRHFHKIDFSDIRQTGTYKIVVKYSNGNEIESDSFRIQENLLIDQTLNDLLGYFHSQRCSGVFNETDRALPFYGGQEKRTVDVHGGWYDASGDVSKYLSHLSFANYLNPQQTPMVVWIMAHIAETLTQVDSNLIDKIREEAIYGADFLVRMQDEAGYFYMTIFDKWSKDITEREICSYKTQDGHKYDTWQAGWRQGGGVSIAALARVSRMEQHGKFSSQQYLETAITGFKHLKEHGINYLDDGKENIIDDYCVLLAAVELYLATKEQQYYQEAKERTERLLQRIESDENHTGWLRADETGERPYYHAAEAGLPIIAMINFLEIEEDESFRQKILTGLKQLIQFQIAINKEVANPFGYPRQYVKPVNGEKNSTFFMPHNNESGYWWQGENARLGSLTTAVGLAFPYFQDDQELSAELTALATDPIDWIFGLNPFDSCMIQGKGRNNLIYDHDAENVTGGVCNGITGGYENEEDIAFAPEGAGTDPDQSWRWGEQWIPHAAWLMAGLSAYSEMQALLQSDS